MKAAPVVTGIGVVAPNGLGTEEWWRATLAGSTGSGPSPTTTPPAIPSPSSAASPASRPPTTSRAAAATDGPGHPARPHGGRLGARRLRRRPAALPEYGIGVVTSNATGGFEFTHREIRKLWTEGPERVSVYESFAWFYAVNTGQISIRNGLRGPSGVLVAEQAGWTRRDRTRPPHPAPRRCAVADGRCGVRVRPVGARLAPLQRKALARPRPGAGLPALRHTGLRSCAGRGRRHPRTGGRRGRGPARSRADLRRDRGYAATFDPRPGRLPPGLGRAARLALADASVTAEDVDVVFADAAALPALDDIEATVIEELFGPYGVPVTVPKTLTGRLAGVARPGRGGGSARSGTACCRRPATWSGWSPRTGSTWCAESPAERPSVRPWCWPVDTAASTRQSSSAHRTRPDPPAAGRVVRFGASGCGRPGRPSLTSDANGPATGAAPIRGTPARTPARRTESSRQPPSGAAVRDGGRPRTPKDDATACRPEPPRQQAPHGGHLGRPAHSHRHRRAERGTR